MYDIDIKTLSAASLGNEGCLSCTFLARMSKQAGAVVIFNLLDLKICLADIKSIDNKEIYVDK